MASVKRKPRLDTSDFQGRYPDINTQFANKLEVVHDNIRKSLKRKYINKVKRTVYEKFAPLLESETQFRITKYKHVITGHMRRSIKVRARKHPFIRYRGDADYTWFVEHVASPGLFIQDTFNHILPEMGEEILDGLGEMAVNNFESYK